MEKSEKDDLNELNSYKLVFGDKLGEYVDRSIKNIQWPSCDTYKYDFLLYKIANGKIDKFNGDKSRNSNIYIRGFGRDKKEENNVNLTTAKELIKKCFGIRVEVDKGSNVQPRNILLKNLPNKRYKNWKASHIFEERTLNPWLFCAPWMTCYTPSFFDPFTGHESEGYDDFRKQFIDEALRKETVQEGIKKYNDIIKDKLNDLATKNIVYSEDESKILPYIKTAFSPIIPDIEKKSSKERKKCYMIMFKKQWWNNHANWIKNDYELTDYANQIIKEGLSKEVE